MLDCDVERNALNAELDKLMEDESEKNEEETEKEAQRIEEITDRLDFIGADDAEQKAKDIILGVGF
jgi:hypothetical protein